MKSLVTDFTPIPGPQNEGADVEHYVFDLGNGWLVSAMRGHLDGLANGRARDTEGLAEGKWEAILLRRTGLSAVLNIIGEPVFTDPEYPEDGSVPSFTNEELNGLLARVSERKNQ